MVIPNCGLVGWQRGHQTSRWNGLANDEFQRVRISFRVITVLRISSSADFRVPQLSELLHIHVFEKHPADLWRYDLLGNAIACQFSLKFHTGQQ